MRILEPIRGWIAALVRSMAGARRCEVDGRTLEFRGRTLHEAMTENGIDPGGHCRTGRCGRCRVRCLEGRFRLLAPEGWAGGGEILACQVVPGSSLRCVRPGVLDSRAVR